MSSRGSLLTSTSGDFPASAEAGSRAKVSFPNKRTHQVSLSEKPDSYELCGVVLSSEGVSAHTGGDDSARLDLALRAWRRNETARLCGFRLDADGALVGESTVPKIGLTPEEIRERVRALGEFQGRQRLYVGQSPEVVETLRRVALVQSVESSNRIEGITVDPSRLQGLVNQKSRPRDRCEQEVAGYRDVLAGIHANHASMKLSTDLILRWHRAMYRYTGEPAGAWKSRDNAILEVRPDGREVVRWKPISALGTPDFMKRLIALFLDSVTKRETDPLFLIASFVLDFECIHPFVDGNGRIGRLLTLLLLYQAGYEVGRYISLERIVEESKETYYEALHRSSQGWHAGQHDLRPWWNYFLGTLTAAFNEFEARVGTITSARGAKRSMVRRAVELLPEQFTIGDLQRACPDVSYPTLQRALADLKREGRVRCLGRGPDASWERRGG